MDKIIAKMPVGIAVEFTCQNTTNTNIRATAAMRRFVLITPRNADLGGKLGDVFVIFKIGPKLNFGTGFLL